MVFLDDGLTKLCSWKCRKGTAILIGLLLLFSLMSIKKSEAGPGGIHHRKLGAHEFAFVDPENPEVWEFFMICQATSTTTPQHFWKTFL